MPFLNTSNISQHKLQEVRLMLETVFLLDLSKFPQSIAGLLGRQLQTQPRAAQMASRRHRNTPEEITPHTAVSACPSCPVSPTLCATKERKNLPLCTQQSFPPWSRVHRTSWERAAGNRSKAVKTWAPGDSKAGLQHQHASPREVKGDEILYPH